MLRHRGIAVPTVSLATGRRGRGFVDEGRESPASRVAARTPRRRENPPHTRHTPSQPGNVAGRRSGLREDPAGLNFPTPTKPQPRHHKKPHNPQPTTPNNPPPPPPPPNSHTPP